MDTQGKLYLGRIFDPQQGKTNDQPLLYDPDDLTTHGIVVGMTGSGKTGLCIDMLEEAALRGTPALMIDPKGDITNTLLHFPDLLPADFQPWVNADEARRSGKSLEEASSEAATLWKNGLQDWGIESSRLRQLKASVQFSVFTPGSDSGLPVSILASLKAPQIPWENNKETLRESISGTVTGLLGLVGMSDVDPVRSREHILLSNIFENAWSQGKDLDLGELILQVQSPPFAKLGVFDVNTFFPEKDRFSLAMLLNNILAAPSFQAWLEGQPLDIQGLLYTPDGRPRHSVFYIAHLSEAERMFFVTLLFSAVETWMRAQTGTTTLRALIYFDEIFGYLPPTRNPASKQVMLRMLKQARAFGVGLVLATQNPVDVDYKGISNTGSWFIGRLQTDQDKQRLLDGLQGAAPGINRAVYDRMLSTLGKRVFLMHNVHAKGPVQFQTRWAMNYLAGPLTRNQIPALNTLAGATLESPNSAQPLALQTGVSAVEIPHQAVPIPFAAQQPPTQTSQTSTQDQEGSRTRPALPGRVREYFLPNNLTVSQAFKSASRTMPADVKTAALLYRPVLLGQANIRFLDRKIDLDNSVVRTILVETPDRRGMVRWENYPAAEISIEELDHEPDPQGMFSSLEAPLNDARLLTSLEKDFLDWSFQTTVARVWAHDTLKVYSGPETSRAEFLQQCTEAARSARDAELQKVAATFDRKLETLNTKLTAEERELARDQSEHSNRKMEELGTGVQNVLSLFGGRKRSLTTSLSKRRMTDKAKADVEESIKAIEDFKRQLAALDKEKTQTLQEVAERWGEIANDVREMSVSPLKKDVRLDLFGVAWMPYHLVDTPEGRLELPGYGRV